MSSKFYKVLTKYKISIRIKWQLIRYIVNTSFVGIRASVKNLIQHFNNKQSREDFREGFFQDFLKSSVNSKYCQLYQNLQIYPLKDRVDYLKTALEDLTFDEDKNSIQDFMKKIDNLNPDLNSNITSRTKPGANINPNTSPETQDYSPLQAMQSLAKSANDIPFIINLNLINLTVHTTSPNTPTNLEIKATFTEFTRF